NVSSPDNADGTFKNWLRFSEVNAKKPLSNMIFIGDAATSIEPLRSVDGTAYNMGPWGFQINPKPEAFSASLGDRHQGAVSNVLFMDGHAGSHKWEELAGLPGDPDL